MDERQVVGTWNRYPLLSNQREQEKRGTELHFIQYQSEPHGSTISSQLPLVFHLALLSGISNDSTHWQNSGQKATLMYRDTSEKEKLFSVLIVCRLHFAYFEEEAMQSR